MFGVLLSVNMLQNFRAGDYLIFQIESGFGLLRVLDIEETARGIIWHLAAYNELFPEVELADAAFDSEALTISHPHLALTDRAFESTQVSLMRNKELSTDDLAAYEVWKRNGGEVSDRSVRLLLGLR